uniref:Uncharacterized protein n=1 Tax=Xenopus tropicalis TaxID=8364 RepID=A0A1B8Y7H0_XENTR
MFQSTQPDQQSLTFAYSEVEAARIIESSKGSSTFLLSLSNQDVIKDYEREKRKLIGLELHVITLTEYYRAKRIPRGLRVSLRPTIFKDNVEFTTKYEQIVNKCSFDIILLNIEYLQSEVADTKQRLQMIESELKQLAQTEEQQDLLRHTEEILFKHRQSIEERKRHKFLRDEADYNTGRIYKWQHESGTFGTPRGHKRQALQRDQRSVHSPEGRERRAVQQDRKFVHRGREREERFTARSSPTSSNYGDSTSEASSSSFLGLGIMRSSQRKGGAAGDTGGQKERRQ